MIKLLGQFNSKKDQTKKWVFENTNNEIIEISLISSKNQDIIYVPTHYNCPLGCKECNLCDVCQGEELKSIGFGDLMAAIDETILSNDKRNSNNTKILVSFRGVGEPLLNLALIEKMYNGKYNLEKWGYTKIGFEISTMMPNESLEYLMKNIKDGKYPLRIIYRLSSPCDDKRKFLTPSATLSVDTSLGYLNRFRDEVYQNVEIKQRYRDFFGKKSPVEILYSIIPGVNDTQFELVNLEYFGSRFQIPIAFLKNKTGEEEWIEYILRYYPDLKMSIAKPMGRDIACEHGEFDTNIYCSQDDIAESISSDNVLKIHHFNEKQKVLQNKVV